CCLLARMFFFSSRRRHTRFSRDWSSDVCSSDLDGNKVFATGYASGALFPGCRHGGGRDAFLVTYDVVATSDDINRKDEVLKPGWQGEGCSVSGWPIQIGTSANEQGSVLAITPSRKLLWLIEREENGGRTVEIRPYDLEGRPLIQ